MPKACITIAGVKSLWPIDVAPFQDIISLMQNHMSQNVYTEFS